MIMTNAETIRKIMVKQGIPEEVIAQFDFLAVRGKYAPALALTGQMDELLTPEQRLAIMQEQGCCITGQPCKAYRAFGKENADKTIAERIPLLDNIDTDHKYNVRLNTDGTLSVWWALGEPGNYDCPCPATRNVQRPRNISKTHCACCGGHARYHLHNGLGVKLRLREVVSSSVSSDSKERCEFLFEIVGGK
jgi:hypothetical protein